MLKLYVHNLIIHTKRTLMRSFVSDYLDKCLHYDLHRINYRPACQSILWSLQAIKRTSECRHRLHHSKGPHPPSLQATANRTVLASIYTYVRLSTYFVFQTKYHILITALGILFRYVSVSPTLVFHVKLNQNLTK
jgi:hypothetical protein